MAKDGIYPRGEGTWRIAYDAPRGLDGGRKHLYKTFKGTRKEAEAERRRILGEIDNGSFVEPTKLTVGDFLNKWLADCVQTTVRPHVYRRYEGIVRVHLIPAFGRFPLASLKPLHIQAAYSQWQRDGSRKDGRPGALSKQTVLHHHRVLHKAMKQAVKWELLTRNPVDGAEAPKPKPTEKKVMNEEEMVRMFHAAKGDRHYIAFLLAATTGLRRGELCGLRWGDVDLDAAKLTVCRSIGETKGELHIHEPKTAKGLRPVDLPAFVVKELRHHKGEQARVRLLLGNTYENHDLVIARDDSRMVRPNSLTNGFTALRKKLGLSTTLHGLRHSHASHLMREDVHIKVVSERLGHSRVGFTLDTYSHLLPSQQEEAARRIDEAFRSAMGE